MFVRVSIVLFFPSEGDVAIVPAWDIVVMSSERYDLELLFLVKVTVLRF